MATYQYVLPGMGADAANRFAALIATERERADSHPAENTSSKRR